jgi:outer membrane protein OmpA-like peptidoglycan-associated protein
MRSALITLLFTFTIAAGGSELESTLFGALEAALDKGKQDQLDVLTPEAWDDAIAAHARARTNFERNRSLETIRRYIADSEEALARAVEAAPLARLTFEREMAARADALSANANRLAAKTWDKAESQLRRAASTLEGGRSDRAQRQGKDALDSYRSAELEAIKGAILIDARGLLERADEEKVERYAPRSLATARETLAAAEKSLAEDRYDTDRPRLLARQAREQASHALYLTAIIKAVDDNDAPLEQVLLDAEKPVLRIADAFNVTPDISNGVASTADAVVAEAKKSRKRESDLNLAVAERDERIASLETTLGGVSQETMTLNSLLAEQEARRTQLEQVERLFDDSEAEVLRTANSVILRLVGLTFDSGSDVIRPDHFALLTKVQQAMRVYEGSAFTVEGHTDSFGSDELNFQLSQRRAEAVRSYLIANMGLADYRISAVGFGETRPVANNETAEGRARNRRIDLVILRD